MAHRQPPGVPPQWQKPPDQGPWQPYPGRPPQGQQPPWGDPQGDYGQRPQQGYGQPQFPYGQPPYPEVAPSFQPRYGQPDPQWQQPQYQAPAPPQAQKRKKGRGPLIGCAAVLLLIVVAIIAIGANGGSKPSASFASAPASHAASPAAKATGSAKATKTSQTSAAVKACEARPNPGGDFYLRMLSPGTGWYSQELGDEYTWNYTLGKCLTGEQLMMATAPQNNGSCTQAGLVSENPGYDINANVAPPLKTIDKETGPSC